MAAGRMAALKLSPKLSNHHRLVRLHVSSTRHTPAASIIRLEREHGHVPSSECGNKRWRAR